MVRGFLRDEIICLRLIERVDTDLIPGWRNAPETWKNFFNEFPLSIGGQETWFENLQRDKNKIVFMICRIKEGVESVPLGMISVYDIDHRNQSAEIGNVVINSRERKNGFATRALSLLMDYCFFHLNLNRISVEVFASNKIARKIYDNAGFMVDGVLREAIFSEGLLKDVMVMSKLRKEHK